MSTLKVNSIEPANAGSEDYFLARAWATFDMSVSTTIDASGNTSSITDNGTGYATINFSNQFSDAFYTMSGSCIGLNFGSGYDGIVIRPVTQVGDPAPEMGTSSCSVQIGASGLKDYEYNSVVFHR